jgi:hypothetical protein
MFNSRTLLLICIALSAGSLGLAFALSGNLPATLLALAIGLVWALPELPRTPPWAQKRLAGLAGDWLANICFGLLSLGAAWVSLSGRPWWLGFWIVAVALAAWDLHAFRRRAFSAQRPGEPTWLYAYHPAGLGQAGTGSSTDIAGSTRAESAAFDRAHLRALGWVWLVGVAGAAGLYGLARLLRFSAELGLALGVSLALVVGMLLLARLLAKH